MKRLFWNETLINIIGSYLDLCVGGLLNFLSPRYYNPKLKLNINGFILDDKMREWFCSYFNFDMDIVDCNWAAEKGYLNCLKYAKKNDCFWDERTCNKAAKNGHLDCLKYAIENGCPWDEWTCVWAAQYGHLEVLQWARTNGCPWDSWTCACAAMNWHLEVLQWAISNGCPCDQSHLELLGY